MRMAIKADCKCRKTCLRSNNEIFSLSSLDIVARETASSFAVYVCVAQMGREANSSGMFVTRAALAGRGR